MNTKLIIMMSIGKMTKEKWDDVVEIELKTFVQKILD